MVTNFEVSAKNSITHRPSILLGHDMLSTCKVYAADFKHQIMNILARKINGKKWVASLFCLFLINAFCAPLYANDWLTSDTYIGAWQTTRVHQKFPLAQRIMFELWKSPDGKPEGVGIFVRRQGKCWGAISFKASTGKLHFTPNQSQVCQGLKGGHFHFMRVFGTQAVMLTFVPDGVEDTPQLLLTHTASYRRLPKSPPDLQALAEGARNGGQSVSQNIQQSGAKHAKRVKELQDSLGPDFQPYFSESHLIGVWRGEFIDERKSYPAEIAMWSMKDASLYKIAGLVVFQDDHCSNIVRITDTSTQLTWRMGSSRISRQNSTCEEIHAEGPLALSPDENRLIINVRVNPSNQTEQSMGNCLQHHPGNHSPNSCQLAGVFLRSTPSQKLNQAVATIPWSYQVKGPEQGHWELLKGNDSGLTRLQALHNTRLKKNAEFFASLGKNLAEAERKREEERRKHIAQRRKQKAAEAERRARTEREWAARQSGKPYDEAAIIELPPLPTVEGPFTTLRGGNFLNALYQSDFDAIAQFDSYYRQRKIQQRRSGVGKHWTDDILDAAVNSMRLADTVLAIYLFYFEANYKACLRKDAVQFKVVKVVPDVVIENLIGVEIARHYGWTERRYFKVNKDFEIAFRRIGTTEPEGAMATLSDFLLNQGGTDLRRELLAGTKQMMKTFPCNSQPVQRLKKTLLTFSTR